jgi:hypothetical protein
MSTSASDPLVARLRQLRDLFKSYRVGSEDAAKREARAKHTREAHGRWCEEAVLAVVVKEMDALLASLPPSEDAQGETCPYCKERCQHGFCGRCERVLVATTDRST